MASLMAEQQIFIDSTPHLEIASGSIASFQTDMRSSLSSLISRFYPVQASGTPTPSAPIPIYGWDSLDAFSRGENLFDVDTPITRGQYVSGTYEQNSGRILTDYIPIKAGVTYTMSIDPTADNLAWINYNLFSRDKTWLGGRSENGESTGFSGQTEHTFTVNISNSCYIRLVARDKTNAAASIADKTLANSKVQLEVGSVKTTYEEYNGSTNTINFPTTYYGGYIDAVRGVGVVTYGYVNLGSSAWINEDSTLSGLVRSSWTSGYMPGIKYIGILYCTNYKGVQKSSWSDIDYGEISVTNTQAVPILRIRDSQFVGKTDNEIKALLNGVYLAYELYTPQSFSFTPITLKTLYGTNNIWSSGNGDTETQFWTHGGAVKNRIKVNWNQWARPFDGAYYKIQNANYAVATFENGEAISKVTKNLNAIFYSDIRTKGTIPVASGDVLYARQQINPSAENVSYCIVISNSTPATQVEANVWTTISGLINYSGSSNYIYFGRPNIKLQQGDITHSRLPMVVNLTQMFGAGNEPTLAEFETQCLKNGIDLNTYQPYNSGTERWWYV